jgi:hypothetical protein
LITKSGAFCKKCIKQRQIIKLHNTVNAICNIESLSDKIKNDNIFTKIITFFYKNNKIYHTIVRNEKDFKEK